MDIIKIGFSGGTLGKNNGCEQAPEVIVKEISRNLLNEEGRLSVLNVKEFSVDNSNVEETHSKIFEQANSLELDNTLFIGGDHSISYSLIKAFCSKVQNPGLVIFDAHPDLMPCFKPATHDNYLRMLIEERVINPENVILVGVRVIDAQELDFLREKKIKYYSMKQLNEDSELILHLMEFLRKFDGVYMSLDIDVVDPVFAPGTGHCEVGGVSSRDILHYVQKLRLLANLKWIDLVEINPEKDVSGLTVKLGTKLVCEAGV